MMTKFAIFALFFLLLMLLALSYALLKKGTRPKTQYRSRNLTHSLIGSYGILLTDLRPGSLGRIELHGTLWNAESFETIAKGTRVLVIAHENLSLTVTTGDHV